MLTFKEMLEMNVDYMTPKMEIYHIQDYNKYFKDHGKYPEEGLMVTDPDGELLGYVDNEIIQNYI